MDPIDHVSALTPGTQLQSYVVERVLGAGSFGITYLAREEVTGRSVAIKEYLPAAFALRERESTGVRPISSAMEGDFQWGLERFRREATLLVGIKHPNVVPVLAYFEVNATGYLVMEFQHGDTLAHILQSEGVLDEARTLRIMRGVLDGVEEVHRRGYLHRDLKPDNIFVRTDGTGLLLDFGAARRAAAGANQALTAILTEGYAPFEQYSASGNQGRWSDVYALGAILFRCLLGGPPTEAPKRAAASLRGAPDPIAPALAEMRQRASPATAAAITAALQEAEADRPQSIAALRALLDGAAAPAGEAGSSGGEARSPAGEPTLIVAQASRLGPPAASAPVPDLVAFRGQRILAAEPSRAWRWSRHALYGAALVLVGAAGAAAFIDDHGWLPGAYQEATRKADAPREHRAAEAREESGTRTHGPATPQARRAARQMSAAERSSMAQLATFRRLVEARQRAAIAQRQRTAKAAPADRQPQAADQARGPEQKPAPAEESPRVQDPQRVEELGRSADDARRAADDARRAAEERMRIAAQGRHAVDAHVEGTARPPPLPPNRPPERQSDTSWPPALPGQGAPPPRRVQRDPLDPAIPGYGLRVPADGWRVQPYETY